ncbi:hypothetical protein BGZ49_006365 [Haplosporangium sp. Z 27]|nr:hypothetical protein BGZ49_006365 [Haplosporangium sp. Z 27]
MSAKSRRHPEFYTGRAWGSFVYTVDGEQKTFRFTKQGNEGHRGFLGYVFGRRPDSDFILPPSSMASSRHFLIYKEVECATECVYLQDLSKNGTLVNDVLIGTGKTTRLQHGDIITYAESIVRGREGTGSFASVHIAEERKSGTTYAVKVIKKSGDFSIKSAVSLEREIGTLMSIDHPSLLRMYKVFSEEKYHYVVTELARGGELFDRVREKHHLTESEARFVFRQLLEGVKYLHDRGIVHRDLKLENVLLMDKDSLIVRISDFGLSSVIEDQKFLRTICGTPNYEDLAPPTLRNQVLENTYTFPSPYWDDVSNEATDMIQDLLIQNTRLRLTVDGALAHTWMNLKDDERTLPKSPRTDIMPQVNNLVKRLSTQHIDKMRERSRSRSSQSLRSQRSHHSQQSYHSQVSQSSSSVDEPVKSHDSFTMSSSTPLENNGHSGSTIPVLSHGNDSKSINGDKGLRSDIKSEKLDTEKNQDGHEEQKDLKEQLYTFESSAETPVTVVPDSSRTIDVRAMKRRRM